MPLDESLDLLREQLRSAEPAPETMKLLRAVWRTADVVTKEVLLTELGSPPSEEEVARWSEDDAHHRNLLRQWRWLAGLSDDLPESWRAANARLTATFGEGDPLARRRSFTVRAGSISPLSADEITRLGPDRFVDWLHQWEVPPRGWENPTPAGLADQLSRAVQSAPAEWDSRLPALIERLRHPTYVRAVLDGLRESLKADQGAVPWDRLLPALEFATSDPWPVARIAEDDFDADSDWAETHRAAIWLIQEAVDRDTEFSTGALARLWDVLVRLMRRRERASGVTGDDLLTVAINTMSTRALEAMFSLTLSVSRRGLDLAPWGEHLLAVVEDELGSGSSEAQLAGAIVARLFPQFLHVCGERAHDFIEPIFGAPAVEELRHRVFETLIGYARPISNEMLVRFRSHLQVYLELTRDLPENEARREAPRWLMIGYLRGVDGYDNTHTLLDELSVPSRISEAAEYIGRVLRESTEVEGAVLQRALQLWNDALSDEALAESAYHGFGWWAEATMIPNEVWLDLMYRTLQRTLGRIDWDDQVVQRLIALKDFPDAWRALSLVVRGAQDRWTVSYWGRNLHDLFAQSAEAPEEIQTLREELVERLLERELVDFRPYLRSR